MYAHAYQSYVWNLVSAERVKLSSTEPLVGDLVYANKDEDEEEPVEGKSAICFRQLESLEAKADIQARLENARPRQRSR
jgi:tRNA(Glu) U13 pseudouridine synthase TruD